MKNQWRFSVLTPAGITTILEASFPTYQALYMHIIEAIKHPAEKKFLAFCPAEATKAQLDTLNRYVITTVVDE